MKLGGRLSSLSIYPLQRVLATPAGVGPAVKPLVKSHDARLSRLSRSEELLQERAVQLRSLAPTAKALGTQDAGSDIT